MRYVHEQLAQLDRYAALLPEAYYRPNALEAWKKGYIYECLGVRFFKRWVFTGGDKIRAATGIHAFTSGSLGSDTPDRQLVEYEKSTRRNEFPHVAGLLGMAALTVVQVAINGHPALTALCVGLNVVVNFYPVISQRYNRVRIIALQEKRASLREREALRD